MQHAGKKSLFAIDVHFSIADPGLRPGLYFTVSDGILWQLPGAVRVLRPYNF